MKTTFFIFTALALLVGCSGPGGPAQRAGAAVDHAVYKVGEGLETAGQKIERSAQ